MELIGNRTRLGGAEEGDPDIPLGGGTPLSVATSPAPIPPLSLGSGIIFEQTRSLLEMQMHLLANLTQLNAEQLVLLGSQLLRVELGQVGQQVPLHLEQTTWPPPPFMMPHCQQPRRRLPFCVVVLAHFCFFVYLLVSFHFMRLTRRSKAAAADHGRRLL